MATIDIGKLTFTHKGDYAGGTAYVANDVVYYNGSAYIAKTSTTGNLPTSTAHWNLFSAGSGGIWNSGLALGTAGQAVKVNSAANALEFGTISSGTYSVHAFDEYNYGTNVSHSGSSNYIDIAGGNTVNFTPTSTNDYIFFTHYCDIYAGSSQSGDDVYLIMKASSSAITGSDIKLNYSGQHTEYVNAANYHHMMNKTFLLPCSSLTAGTTYYVEQAGASHTGNAIIWNHLNNSGDNTYGKIRHYVSLTHYKKN